MENEDPHIGPDGKKLKSLCWSLFPSYSSLRSCRCNYDWMNLDLLQFLSFSCWFLRGNTDTRWRSLQAPGGPSTNTTPLISFLEAPLTKLINFLETQKVTANVVKHRNDLMSRLNASGLLPSGTIRTTGYWPADEAERLLFVRFHSETRHRVQIQAGLGRIPPRLLGVMQDQGCISPSQGHPVPAGKRSLAAISS